MEAPSLYSAGNEDEPAIPSKYTSSKVLCGDWWEERAWTERTDGTRAAASMGARPFGRRQACTPSETHARTDGHDTSDLTSMGHNYPLMHDSLSTAGIPVSGATSRRGYIAPPSTNGVEAALHGANDLQAADEGLIYEQAGCMSTPHHSGRAGGTYHPTECPAAPFQRDDQPWATSTLPAAGACADGARCLASAPSLLAFVGQVEEPSPRQSFVHPSVSQPSAPPPPAYAPPKPTAAAQSQALAWVARLHAGLADRHRPWDVAFRPLDQQGTGRVGLESLLRLFRSVALAVPPELLNALPQDPVGYVDYNALAALAVGGANAEAPVQPLLSSSNTAVHIPLSVGHQRHAHIYDRAAADHYAL